MKKITMFILPTCPYCRQAISWMEQLKTENPEYALLQVEMIDEAKQPDLANRHDYYYVPTYYVDGIKLHEGTATLEKVRAVFDAALS